MAKRKKQKPRVELVRGLSFEDYMDENDRPYMSKTTAKRILNHSPLYAWTYHPALGKESQPPKDCFDKGNIIEEMLLHGGDSKIDVHDFTAWTTKEAKLAKAMSRAAGRVPVLKFKHDEYKVAVKAIRKSLEKKEYPLNEMEVQVSMFWEQNGVACKGRMDCWWADRGIIFDIKTIESLTEAAIRNQITKFGYDIQAAAYVRAMAEIDRKWAGRLHFILCFVETSVPYDTCLVPIRGAMLELGQRRWNRAVEKWRHCLEVDEWRGMPRLTNIEPPAWLMESEMMEGTK